MKMSKIEATLRSGLAFYDAFNRHDVKGIMRLMSDDCRFETAGPAPDGTSIIGKEPTAQYWSRFFRKSPHARIEIEDIGGLGKQCVAYWKYYWIDAEDREMYIRGVDIFKMKEKFISELYRYIKGDLDANDTD